MNRLTQVRIFKVLALGVLLSGSTMAIAGPDNGRGHSNDRNDRGYSDNRGRSNGQGHSNDRRYSDNRGHSNGKSNGKHGQKNNGNHGGKNHNKHHDNRYYAQSNRYQYRHKHNGRYCNVRHYPGYAAQYGTTVFLPRPPAVVLYPPRIGVFFGGRINF